MARLMEFHHQHFYKNLTKGLEILERVLAIPVRRESQSEEIEDHSQSWIYQIIAYLSFFFQTLVNYLDNQESHSKKKWSSISPAQGL
jgi:hypothetical protein